RLRTRVSKHGQGRPASSAYGKIDEIPFDFTRRRMSVVIDHEHRDHQLICKGAADETLAACKFVRDDEPHLDRRAQVVELEEQRRADAKDPNSGTIGRLKASR